MNGIIIKSTGGLYTVLSGGKTYDCRARGAFRRKKSPLLVGDRCVFDADERNGYVINEISPRKNELIRPAISNIDELIVAFAAKSPDPDLLHTDKLVSAAQNLGITPVIVITKADLDENAAENFSRIYKSTGYATFVTSSAKNTGISELSEYIKSRSDKTFSFAGASGVGKSSLMNALFPSIELETGEISSKIERGKHTTRAVSLYELSRDFPGATGFIADTPGFSMLDFVNFDFFGLDALPHTFAEFESLLGKCRWRDCTHTKEDGCAIKDAVKSGAIMPERYASYISMYEELKSKKEWQ